MVEFDNSNRRHRDDRRVGWSCKRIWGRHLDVSLLWLWYHIR
jgi:hypothetical protein